MITLINKCGSNILKKRPYKFLCYFIVKLYVDGEGMGQSPFPIEPHAKGHLKPLCWWTVEGRRPTGPRWKPGWGGGGGHVKVGVKGRRIVREENQKAVRPVCGGWLCCSTGGTGIQVLVFYQIGSKMKAGIFVTIPVFATWNCKNDRKCSLLMCFLGNLHLN